MLWVCRPGNAAQFYSNFIDESKIYLAWEGYNQDLSSFENKEEFRNLVANEKHTDNRTSISNWSGQLINFTKDICIGDFVLIPNNKKRIYVLAEVIGEYTYEPDYVLHHSRRVRIIKTEIKRDIFSREILYALGAYRTLFKMKKETQFFEELGEI